MAIVELKKNEKYKIESFLGYDVNGKKKRKCETFYGKKSDAKALDEKIKRELKNGIFYDRNMTFEELSNIWMKEHVISKLAPKTIESYRQMLPFVINNIGQYKIAKLNPFILETLYNNLRNRPMKKKLTDNTILHYYTMINVIFNKAVKWKFLESNPNQYIERPKVAKKEIPYYNSEQVKYLLNSIKDECLKYQAIIYLALDTGARRGELTGLEWSDINFDKNTISINKVTQTYEGKIIQKSNPKNNSSVRTIQITDNTIEILKTYKREQDELKMLLGNKWINTNKVLTNDFGGLIHPDTPSKIFYKLIRKCGLPHIKFHSLRHTSASLLIALGANTKAISKRLGHSSITTTDMIYSHVFSSLDGDAADKLSTVFDS